jgi:hypothetical protein
MRQRPHYPQVRELTHDEVDATARCLNEHWPGRTPARTHVKWNHQLVIEWRPDSGPVIEQRLPLVHLAEHITVDPPKNGDELAPVIVPPLCEEHPTNYRQDRPGEQWHIVPENEHGLRGRALCGAPRQGTRLSEAHAQLAPLPPERMCPHCLDLLDSVTGSDSNDVLASTAF